MAKKSMINRDKNRKKLYLKFSKKREELLKAFKKMENFDEKLIAHAKLQNLPRNSSKIRLRNRCWKTGRPRGVYRDFGLSRHTLRKMAHNGLLPGVIKSSW